MSYMMEKCSIRPVTKKFHAQLWFFLFSMAKKNKKTFNAKEFIEFLGEGQLKLFQNYREKKSKPKENVTDLLNQYTDLGLLHKQHEDKIFLIRYERMPQIFFESGNNSKNKWKKILELYFERESSFRRVIAVLLSSLPRESISIKEIKINASIPMPTADHIIRILRYAGILKK